MTTLTRSRPLSEVEAFLSQGVLRGVLGGHDVAAAGGGTFVTLDPGTSEPLAEVTDMQAADIDRAVHAATDAFNIGWAKMPVNERARNSRITPCGRCRGADKAQARTCPSNRVSR